jgi:hypothetical protein
MLQGARRQNAAEFTNAELSVVSCKPLLGDGPLLSQIEVDHPTECQSEQGGE